MPTTKRKPKQKAPVTSPDRSFSERNGKYLTKEEVADYFGVTKRKVQRMLDRGELRATKIGKLVRVHVDDLDAYEAQVRGEAGR